MKYFFLPCIALLLATFSLAQTIGSKVAFAAVDGKNYTGVINDVRGDKYKVKYDGFDFESWLTDKQFTVTNSDTPAYSTATTSNELLGVKVSFPGTDGKIYTGIINDKRGNSYKIRYDGFDFEAWATKEQFKVVSTTTTSQVSYKQTGQQPNYIPQNTGTKAPAQDVLDIFDFGRRQGWASQVHQVKLNNFLVPLSGEAKNKLTAFLNQANTPSARFFALKSLLSGDSYTVIQKFIEQLNAYPESYQQEKCLITNHRSIIQQWQNTCSVTAVQAFLADLCPRYSWEVKQVNNFDVAANDPNNPMAQQQKILLEKFGAEPTARGDVSGKVIPINGALDEFVGPILGVHFYTQEVNESLSSVFLKIRNQLDKGLDVPLLVGFVGTQARHFILTMKYRNNGNGIEYLIYDPWDGVCDYVSESNIMQGSLSPLNTQWHISLDYYYPTN